MKTQSKIGTEELGGFAIVSVAVVLWIGEYFAILRSVSYVLAFTLAVAAIICFWRSILSWTNKTIKKIFLAGYSVSEDGQWVWVTTKEKPTTGIEGKDYRGTFFDRGYSVRLPNTWFNRNKQLLSGHCIKLAYFLAIASPCLLVIILGSIFSWPSIITGSIVIALFILEVRYVPSFHK